MKKPFKKNEPTPPMANEPATGYYAAPSPSHGQSPVPNGCMTLDQFAEKFHQKLDDCYAELSNCCK